MKFLTVRFSFIGNIARILFLFWQAIAVLTLMSAFEKPGWNDINFAAFGTIWTAGSVSLGLLALLYIRGIEEKTQ